MSEPVEKHLHKLYILFPLAGSIKSFIPLIILFGLKIINGGSLKSTLGYWIAAGITAVVLLLIIYGWLQWRRLVYVLEDNKIVIRRGVFFREELSIYTGRIHSMNMEQPLLQRILGLTQVKIDTPGKTDDGGKLPAISGAEAERLQRWLRERTAAGAAQDRTKESYIEGKANVLPDPATWQNNDVIETAANDGASNSNSTAALITGNEEKPESTRREYEISRDASPINSAGKAEGVNTAVSSHSAMIPESSDVPEERTVLLQLSAGRLLLAALTSLNLSLALAFAAGVFSLADDILPKNLYAKLFQEAGHFLPGGWVALIALALVLAWLLSAVLYTIKYAGFTVERVGKQIAVTCGLLERKQMFFSPQRVQAVSVKEGLLRQPFGYGEVKLHVLTSESDKNLMLHPLIPMKDIAALLERIVPQYTADTVDTVPPRRALWLYLRLEVLLTTAACIGLIWYFKTPGLWSLLLFPVSILWAILTHKDAGIALRGKQLTIRSRLITRTTQYIRRPQVISLKVSGTRRQRRNNLRSFEVSLISSQYDGKIYSLEQSAVEAVWKWFRHPKGTHYTEISASESNPL
ncbi:PH domain-containing protein [Paenibacillus sp. N3/727]|uniref:PH domain-containing protein n=1 Tax=Paenibacillus sp. N3/727 TaxID=2925845 RepID=UPI001F535563|nr:PH domain-containing protein [Paenibacillus sp. N3/727]UNK19623.1 PH domain-containing protein [Paenibacillus sp. N3/727]